MQKFDPLRAEPTVVRWAPPEIERGAGASSGSPHDASEGAASSERLGEGSREDESAAKEALHSAKAQGEALLETRKRALADEIKGLERALRRTATELEGQDQRTAGRYAARAADGLERVTRALREQDLTALIEQTEDFARREPRVFLGGAVATGFLLARFLKSSGRWVPPKSQSSGLGESGPDGYRAGLSPRPSVESEGFYASSQADAGRNREF